jgi:putative aldouronate transport system substrate-binding protein
VLACNGNKNEPLLLSFYSDANYVHYPQDGGRGRVVISEKAQKEGINIDFVREYIPQNEYRAVLEQNLLLETSAMAFPIHKDQIQNLAELGLILPLTKYLARMPHYISKLKDSSLDNYIYKGDLYALPRVSRPEGFNGYNIRNGWAIRTDWLENLNLDMPETLEDLEDVLRQFTEMDPDQNGMDDTYGLSLDFNHSMLWGAFGLSYSENFENWILDGESLIHTTTHPQVEKILRLFHSWYEKGYISPESFIENGLAIQSKANVGISSISVWNLNRLNVTWKNEGKLNHLAMMLPVTGPEGDRGYDNDPFLNDGLAISANLSEVEIDRLIRFLDWICDDSEEGGFYTVSYGIEGEHYTLDEEKNRINLLSTYDDLYKAGFSNPVRFISVIDRRWITSQELLDNIEILNDTENLVNEEHIYKFVLEKDTKLKLQKRWEQTMVSIITGTEDLSTWHDYTELFNKEIQDLP